MAQVAAASMRWKGRFADCPGCDRIRFTVAQGVAAWQPPPPSLFLSYSSASYAATVSFVRLESGFGLICFPTPWMAMAAVLTSVTSGFLYSIVLTSFLSVLRRVGVDLSWILIKNET